MINTCTCTYCENIFLKSAKQAMLYMFSVCCCIYTLKLYMRYMTLIPSNLRNCLVHTTSIINIPGFRSTVPGGSPYLALLDLGLGFPLHSSRCAGGPGGRLYRAKRHGSRGSQYPCTVSHQQSSIILSTLDAFHADNPTPMQRVKKTTTQRRTNHYVCSLSA